MMYWSPWNMGISCCKLRNKVDIGSTFQRFSRINCELSSLNNDRTTTEINIWSQSLFATQHELSTVSSNHCRFSLTGAFLSSSYVCVYACAFSYNTEHSLDAQVLLSAASMAKIIAPHTAKASKYPLSNMCTDMADPSRSSLPPVFWFCIIIIKSIL